MSPVDESVIVWHMKRVVVELTVSRGKVMCMCLLMFVYSLCVCRSENNMAVLEVAHLDFKTGTLCGLVCWC